MLFIVSIILTLTAIVSAAVTSPHGSLNGTVDDLTVLCEGHHIKAIWEKSLFTGDNITITLSDATCDKFESNATHVWISSALDACGTVRTVHNKTIVYENMAEIVRHTVYGEVALRRFKYTYKLQCKLDRELTVSSDHYFNASQVIQTAGSFNGSGLSDVRVSLDLYSSSSFQIAESGPITVTSDQPMYVGIRQDNNDEHFKIVVNSCFATPNADINGLEYAFFDQKCPLDRSFQESSKGPHHFNFQIDAFSFIQVRGSVYIHCKLYVCLANSTSHECTQHCHLRERRSLSADRPLEELSVTSQQISYCKKKTCADMTCPENSECVDLYPAVCRCRPGFVYHKKEGVCKNDNILLVRGLHIRDEFVPTYSDDRSADFRRYALKVEREINKVFEANDPNIISTQVVKMTRGSVVVDLLVLYSGAITETDAFDTFMSILMVAKTDPAVLDIKRDIKPEHGKWMGGEDQKTLLLIIAIVLPCVLIVITAILVCRISMIRREVAARITKGVNNDGIQY